MPHAGASLDAPTATSRDPTLYSFEGERHESLCLLDFGQTWRVFISERGQRHEERGFTAEDDACVYF
jgi:hypothetical protein